MVLFAVTTFVLFRFGLDRTSLDGSLAAGVLLATVLFAAILAVNRLFVAERDQGGFDAIRLAPVDGTALFAAKATALTAYLLVLEVATVPAVVAAFSLVFFYAPLDADQGFVQKIFYLHVPLAILALVGFVVAAVHAIRHLRTNDPVHDARSYVSIHISVIFGVAVLATGSIWARASWGKWWVWDEPTLVSFLIVFLLYATYYPLRYAIDDRDRQARYASVFAITAGGVLSPHLPPLPP